jgi:hypothetical protein
VVELGSLVDALGRGLAAAPSEARGGERAPERGAAWVATSDTALAGGAG